LVLNASGVTLNGGHSGTYINPIRSLTGPSLLLYQTDKEVTYTTSFNFNVPSLTGSNNGDYIYWNSTTSSWSVGSTNVNIGSNAGVTSQTGSVSVGEGAGRFNQSASSVAVGVQAGSTGQGPCAVAIGPSSGAVNQGTSSVAIGCTAGYNNQSVNSVALGPLSGSYNQGTGSVAIGWQAGFTGQGRYSVAIGPNAGTTGQSPYSIVLNANETSLNPSTTGFYVNPVRSITGPSYLYYSSSNEVITSNNFIGSSNILVSTTATVPSATWSGEQTVIVNSSTGPVTLFIPPPQYENSRVNIKMLYKRGDPVTLITLNPTGTTYLDASVSERDFVYYNGTWFQVGDINYTNFYPTTLFQSITVSLGLGPITSLTVSNDGFVIALCYNIGSRTDIYQSLNSSSSYTLLQTLLGITVSGTTSAGSNASLSSYGNILAVSYPSSAFGSPGYYVKVYSRTNLSSFSLLQTIAPSGLIQFGDYLSFSADGFILAITARSGFGPGSCYIYYRTASTYNLVHTILSASIVTTGFNSPIALSSDGTTLAIGLPSTNQIQIYKSTDLTWSSSVLQGNFSTSNSMGRSISISADGNVVAAGASGFINNYIRSGTTWSLQQTINGTNDFGAGVSLSADGNTLAISSSSNNAVYIYLKSGPTWNNQPITTFSIANANNLVLSSDANILTVTTTTSNALAYIYT
jgi:hypothetical protein